MHLYDDAYPVASTATLRPPNATLADYKAVQVQWGTERTVVVTPSTYGFDNALLVDALRTLGENGRGVAVISGRESSAQLRQLHAQGVRGVRLNFSHGALHQPDELATIARAIAPLGWHLQLLMSVDQMAAAIPFLESLSVPLVFDHFARIGAGLAGHPVHTWLLGQLRTGNAWVKLSGEYLLTPNGRLGDPDMHTIATSYLKANPGRVLWGSNWPHPTASAGLHPMPDDAALLHHLQLWCRSFPDPEGLMRRVLVDNPAQLYGFTT
jgi:D-galactarolactone isomerase